MTNAPTEDSARVDAVRYHTEVTKVGDMVPGFREKGIVILFGDDAPPELHDISVLHNASVKTGGLAPGDIIELDGHQFPVLAVGHVADANLVKLGHIDLKFNGEDTAKLPGDVCLPAVLPPLVSAGSTFRIIAGTTVTTSSIQEQS